MMEGAQAKKKKVTRVYGKKKGVSKAAAVVFLEDSPARHVQTVEEKSCTTGLLPSHDRDGLGGEKESEGDGGKGSLGKANFGTAKERVGEDGVELVPTKSHTPPGALKAQIVSPRTAKERGVRSQSRHKITAVRPDPQTTGATTTKPSPLDDITLTLNSLHLSTHSLKPPRTQKKPNRAISHHAARPPPPWLTPLFSAYPRASLTPWTTCLSPTWTLTKLAESSYAEVYKVHNALGTSVLKIMALRPPSGPGSRRETACRVDDVVSEVLIMDLMTEVPGFVVFRGAHVVQGRVPSGVVSAWETYDASPREEGDAPRSEDGGGRSEFPHPGRYAREQVFLVLELGDAGTDVEHYVISTVAELWDIFLGIVLALAMGEEVAGFEHRDLHEGNICLLPLHPPRPLPPPPSVHKYGYSGLCTTLLDYTLSRAQNPDTGSILSLDLDTNQELFAESDMLQRQIYRLMRDHVIAQRTPSTTNTATTKRPQKAASTPTSTPDHHIWESSFPYTNVLWLYYALEFIIKSFKGPRGELELFVEEVGEVRGRLRPDCGEGKGGKGGKKGGKGKGGKEGKGGMDGKMGEMGEEMSRRFNNMAELREEVLRRGWVCEGDGAGEGAGGE